MMERLYSVRKQLVDAARKWASGSGYDSDRVAQLRREAVLLNHTHYMATVAAYRKAAVDEGVGEVIDLETIKRKLLFTDGIFKSYDQAWLDGGDFSKMNDWLSKIYHAPVQADVSGVASIDEWIERLKTAGIGVVYSSGTSGAFSFVPRDAIDWQHAREANISCLAALLVSRLGMSSMAGMMLKVMSPEALVKTLTTVGLRDFDAVFLGFRGGRMGNQVLISEMSPLFRRRCYLYDFEVSATALRALRRGTQKEGERQSVASLLSETTGEGKQVNFQRVSKFITEASDAGQKLFIFGAPAQFKELSQAINGTAGVHKGSIALIGGGWKSFAGEAIDRESLLGLVTGGLGLSSQMILEGYSMTETSTLMLRCEHGRFHIPPLIEPVIVDEALEPIEGTDIRGRFGFLDTLAASHPGFIISGDAVHLVDERCPCGLEGPALVEVGRLQGQEIKGCGGIMGSVSA